MCNEIYTKNFPFTNSFVFLSMASNGEKSVRELKLEGYSKERNDTICALRERIEEKVERIRVLTDLVRDTEQRTEDDVGASATLPLKGGWRGRVFQIRNF